jgi:hypothetical protein
MTNRQRVLLEVGAEHTIAKERRMKSFFVVIIMCFFCHNLDCITQFMSLERQIEDVVKSVLKPNTRCLTKTSSATAISICHRHILMLSGISYIWAILRQNTDPSSPIIKSEKT